MPPGRGPKTRVQQESRALEDFQRHFRLTFADPELLKLALTHRSYLSVTGQGPRESNERLEFLGDSVLGLVTSEYLYREHPQEHEGELTKSKSLLVSKAILSRRALAMGLGRFVLMSHSEVESGGRQRLSILADAFEAVIGAVYLDQGFEPARAFIHRWLLRESGEIIADKRHTNYKSHLQEYVQSTWRTHPVYRIRSEMGPDHSKHFQVEVLVGKRSLGEGRGRNKKEAEQAAARSALERAGVEVGGEEPAETASEPVSPAPRGRRPRHQAETEMPVETVEPDLPEGEPFEGESRGRRRGRRGGRSRDRDREREDRPRGHRHEGPADELPPAHDVDAGGRLATPSRRLAPLPEPPEPTPIEPEKEPLPRWREEDDFDEVGRPEGPLEELRVDPYSWSRGAEAPGEPDAGTDDEPVAEPEPPALAIGDDEIVEPEPEPIPPPADDREARGSTRRALPPAAPSPASPPPTFGRRRSRRG